MSIDIYNAPVKSVMVMCHTSKGGRLINITKEREGKLKKIGI
jgi:hypothetical protein